MAWRRHHFQGQFGFNETPLTTAIREGDYRLAEEIIEQTSDPSLLNDGAYEKFPLHLVLCNNHMTDQCRNLRLARLLVEKGADANLRIPYGSLERISPSPFEELVVYYEILKAHVVGNSDILYEELDIYFQYDERKIEFITNTVDMYGEKCEPTDEDCHKLIEQTHELIQIFLACGSDPNVYTTFAHKTLFHWVTEHDDMELARCFLQTCRVNLNLCDGHGNSPLMDAILNNRPENSLSLYEAMCDTVDFVNVNAHNCCGETALFRAVFVGALQVAEKLCENGAEVENNVSLSRVPIPSREDCDGCLVFSLFVLSSLTTPLLAPLLVDAPTRQRYIHVSPSDAVTRVESPHKHLTDKIIISSISPLVDLGCLAKECVTTELNCLLEIVSNVNPLKNDRVQLPELLTLMFGQVSAGLRQLCVRKIFDHVLMVSSLPKKLMPELGKHDYCMRDYIGALNDYRLTEIIDLLGLPQSFKVFFEIEAAKYQMCKLVMAFESVECDQACSDSEDSMFDDDEDDDSVSSDSSESPSDYAESLLFFSSDMLSEESSEEIEDLSEEVSSSDDEDINSRDANTQDRRMSSHKSEEEDLSDGTKEARRKDKYERLNGECSSDSGEEASVSEPVSDSSI